MRFLGLYFLGLGFCLGLHFLGLSLLGLSFLGLSFLEISFTKNLPIRFEMRIFFLPITILRWKVAVRRRGDRATRDAPEAAASRTAE